ncbi:MAG: hypothetical protein A2V72_00010 [Candidatus Nealsonbacteria bacterium RBG_13_37_56]|uniref:Uncharacterized protein n=1 Tax=Candidatus Nealsonbacteria bacterium RBG_13_37_56 TaxID=1801661 RepID=A0A1G2DX94_9BACT|nr:MAG: hypothetical protein A2V72_00010 [Candidatus Nealsonbacteria bacterium RBG_13_37_56]
MKNNNQIKSLRKIELSINTNLFIICSIVTVAAMVLMTTDFFTRGSFVPSRMSLFYLAVVFIYSIHKELIRWLGEKKIKRRGEYFVYAWIILTTALYIINFFTHDYYSYSLEGYRLGALRDISLLTIEILGVFIVSRVLKLLFVFKK